MATNKKKRTALDEILLPPTEGKGSVDKLSKEETETDVPPKMTGEKSLGLNRSKRERRGESSGATSQNTQKGIVKVMLYLPLSVAEQMRGLHFEEQRGNLKRSKLHDYYLEAIDLLFKERGLKSIAELTRD